MDTLHKKRFVIQHTLMEYLCFTTSLQTGEAKPEENKTSQDSGINTPSSISHL